MKTKAVVLTLALSLIGGAMCFAASPQMGTWKLNEGKSKLVKWMGKNHTVVYEAAGRSVKVIVDGVDAKGKATHNEWVGMFNGTDNAVTGDPETDARAYNKVDDHTLNFWQKKDGKVVGSGKIVVSADGKTRTVTVTAPGRKKKMVRTTAVYDKV